MLKIWGIKCDHMTVQSDIKWIYASIHVSTVTEHQHKHGEARHALVFCIINDYTMQSLSTVLWFVNKYCFLISKHWKMQMKPKLVMIHWYFSCLCDPPYFHLRDVMLVWRKGNINKNCLCVKVLWTIIMVHKDTSSCYRSVDCIVGFDLAWFSYLSSKHLCVFGLNGAI